MKVISMRGQSIDMARLAAENATAIALGNASMTPCMSNPNFIISWPRGSGRKEQACLVKIKLLRPALRSCPKILLLISRNFTVIC